MQRNFIHKLELFSLITEYALINVWEQKCIFLSQYLMKYLF